MRVNIGPVLVQEWKKRGITQQQLADFIGVSKAAVSKWETGQTYPDITLLPALAAYFDLRIDDLLDYEPQLAAKEIHSIYASLKQSVTTEPGEKVLARLRSLVRRYYACYPFLEQMGMWLLNHFDQLPGKDTPSKLQAYIPEAQQLFVRVRKNAPDSQLKMRARNMEAYTMVILNKPAAVLDLLGTFTPEYLPSESLIASAQQMLGETDQAQATYQSALYQATSVVASYFTNYLQMLLAEPQRFAETYRRARAFAAVFDLDRLNPLVYCNLLGSAAVGFAQQKQPEQVFAVLTDYAAAYQATTFPVTLHGDAYFDKIGPWLDQLDIGTQTPRNTALVEQSLRDVILNNPVFTAYHDDPRWADIAAAMRPKEKNNHE